MLNYRGRPPESGGQHDRDSSRDRAGGGSRAALFKNAFRDNFVWRTTPRVIAENAMTQRSWLRRAICLHSPSP